MLFARKKSVGISVKKKICRAKRLPNLLIVIALYFLQHEEDYFFLWDWENFVEEDVFSIML